MGSTTVNTPRLSSSFISSVLENHKNMKIELEISDIKKSSFQNLILDIFSETHKSRDKRSVRKNSLTFPRKA